MIASIGARRLSIAPTRGATPSMFSMGGKPVRANIRNTIALIPMVAALGLIRCNAVGSAATIPSALPLGSGIPSKYFSCPSVIRIAVPEMKPLMTEWLKK